MLPLFDAHCDTASSLYENGGDLRDNVGQVDLTRSQYYAPHARFFAYWKLSFSKIHAHFTRQLSRHNDLVSLCRTGAQARVAFAQHKLAAFLSIEGADVVDCHPARLEAAVQAGVRMVSLTWNAPNALAGGADTPELGLTDAGRRCTQFLFSQPVLVDVSHLSERGFWDVIEWAGSKPVIASHSNAFAVCPHRRNLRDDQFSAIVRSGGFVGINLHAPFLASGKPATWEHVWRHIEHFLCLGGAENVGLGCDFDGGIDAPYGCAGLEDLPALYELLLRKNLSEATANSIFFNSLMRVVDNVCTS